MQGVVLKLRTWALYFCMGVYTLTIGIFVILIGLCLPKKYKGIFILNAWIRQMLFFIRHVGGVKYKVLGLDNLKKRPNGVILSNHQSILETFLYQDIFFPVLHIAKVSLKKVPIFGWGLTMIGTIYIDRSKKREARQQILEQGKEKIKQGFRLVIYPEGTRVAVDAKKAYKTGGASAAIDLGCDVFPVAHNAGEFWNKKGIIKTGAATFVIGEPISTQNREAKELTQFVEQWITQTRAELGK